MPKATLEEVMRDVNKKFKSDVCKQGLKFDDVTRIPFSSPRLNYMTYGGVPAGLRKRLVAAVHIRLFAAVLIVDFVLTLRLQLGGILASRFRLTDRLGVVFIGVVISNCHMW